MKAVSSLPTKGLQIGSRIKCIDNTGAKEMEIISIKGYKGVRKRRARAGVCDIVRCAVKKGDQKLVHEIVDVVVVRQVLPWRRPSGIRISFSDNAGIIIDDKLEPKGKEIKGVIAKEVVERFPRVGKIASTIV